MAIFIGTLFLGAGVQFVQIRLTARLVKRKGLAAVGIVAFKTLLWAGLLAGTLLWAHRALLGSVAGCALFILGYAVVHYMSLRKEE